MRWRYGRWLSWDGSVRLVGFHLWCLSAAWRFYAAELLSSIFSTTFVHPKQSARITQHFPIIKPSNSHLKAPQTSVWQCRRTSKNRKWRLCCGNTLEVTLQMTFFVLLLVSRYSWFDNLCTPLTKRINSTNCNPPQTKWYVINTRNSAREPLMASRHYV